MGRCTPPVIHRATSRRIFKDANLLKVLDIDFDGGNGIIGSKGLEKILAPYLPETFEELLYPFAAVSVDVQQGLSCVLRSGPLVRRLCASNAFPGVFDPVEDEGRYFIDGGTLNIVPVDVIRTLTDRPVIAVDVTVPIDRPVDLMGEPEGLWHKLTSRLSPKQLIIPMEVAEKAYTITQGKLAELIYAMHPPDLDHQTPLAGQPHAASLQQDGGGDSLRLRGRNCGAYSRTPAAFAETASPTLERQSHNCAQGLVRLGLS